MTRLNWTLAAIFIIAVAAGTSPARAEYPEHNIDMIVPYGPGGGFDVYARAVGRMMDKILPSGVKVIPRNVPGAGGKRGTATIYRAKPDGYTLGIINLPGMAVPQILGEPAQYDLDKITWVGAVNIGVYAVIVAGKSKFNSIADMRKSSREVYFATAGGTDYATARITASVLDINAKFLTGYKGGPDAQLAVVRGEADAGIGPDVTIEPRIRSHDLKALLALKTGKPLFPGVPVADDVGHPELANLGLYRLFAAPPAMPDAIRTALIGYVQKALADPELAAWGREHHFPIDPGSADMAKKLYTEQRTFLTQYKQLLK
jgi:tripartite-type tricarboxylate transporter receptor subunit TctC